MEKGLEKIVEKAKKDPDVSAVILFGSYAKQQPRPSSDIDVCLMLKPHKYTSLSMSKKKLEYLSLIPDKYDVQIFQQLPVFIKVRILKEGKFLLTKDYDAMFKVALDAIKEYDLFERHYLYCIK
ncbi:MAG: type VII toxin-antitoxin system MntA family adenylyltransferase antitoxin, partial [Candidatus Bathyarchaeia archaeon]